MKREIKLKIVLAACIAVILAGVIALGVYLSGAGEKKRAGDENDEQGLALSQPVFAQSPAMGFSGVWLEQGADFQQADQAQRAVDSISDLGCKTVILSQCEGSATSFIAEYARSKGLYTVSYVNAAEFVEQSAVIQLAQSGVEAVLLDFTAGFSPQEVKSIVAAIRQAEPDMYVGIFANAGAAYTPVCQADVFDFKYIDVTIPTGAIMGEYTEYLADYFDGTTRDTVFGIHAELLGNAPGYDKPDEIMAQLEAVTGTEAFGFGLYRQASLAENESLYKALKEYISTGQIRDFFKELTILKPAKTSYQTNESLISFVGTADATMPLMLNGQAVKMIDDGYFTVEEKLKVGENTFAFAHKDKTVTYKITYSPKLIKSVKPTGSIDAPGDAQLDIVAVAFKSATVKATVNGTTLQLVRSDDYDDGDDGSDYTTFVGTYTLPSATQSEQNLGKIKVTATYSGKSESKTGGTIIVNAEEPDILPPLEEPEETTPATQPPTVSETSSAAPGEEESSSQSTSATTQQQTTAGKTELFKQLTPYSSNGVSGKSKMVVMKKQYGETLPKTTVNDVSVPYYTALPKGTVDYVTGTASYQDDEGKTQNYYVLRSGRRVYKEDVEYLASGYNMPANKIRTVSVNKKAASTDITLTLLWRVPFNVREKPQEFYTQTKGRPYSVKSFTAEYVDITFYYTGSVDSLPDINTSIISRAEWISEGDQEQTLRLYLKKRGGFYGIKYYYNSDDTLTLSIKERSSSAIAGKVIMLDAGHGGNDPGAIGVAIVNSKKIHEATLNLAIATKMKAKLEALGATVIMTRTSADQTISLDSRASATRSKNPDVFVAVHCDASESSGPSGTTAYYYKSYSYPLANYIGKGIVSAYKKTVYASNSAMADKVDKGAKFKGFRVTRIEECPSVLIEFGYVSNVTECKALTKESNQNALAQGAVDGLVNYFKNS